MCNVSDDAFLVVRLLVILWVKLCYLSNIYEYGNEKRLLFVLQNENWNKINT